MTGPTSIKYKVKMMNRETTAVPGFLTNIRWANRPGLELETPPIVFKSNIGLYFQVDRTGKISNFLEDLKAIPNFLGREEHM
jgi:hypothetical protein